MTSKFKLFSSLLIVAFMVIGESTLTASSKTRELGLKTVVLDPGHGGKDPGALGKSKGNHEKDIVLSICKLLGDKIEKEYNDVKVVYTRYDDKFIGLHERAMVAKKNSADLFISVHCNSSENKSARGSSVHILGPRSDNAQNKTDYFERNMSVAQRENGVVVLEDGYETKYKKLDKTSAEMHIGGTLQWMAHYESSLLFATEVIQNLIQEPLVSRKIVLDQDIFQVLVEANMPAVLLELAFISNATEYEYLVSKEGQEEIAERLFKAFKAYKVQYDASVQVSTSEPAPVSKPADKVKEAPAQKSVKAAEKESAPKREYFSIQLMSLGRYIHNGDPVLKGLNVTAIKQDGTQIYKYVTGSYKTKSEAEAAISDVRKSFPDAFIVKVSGNNVSRP